MDRGRTKTGVRDSAFQPTANNAKRHYRLALHVELELDVDDILSLLDLADRQLASSRFDTRLSPPTGRAGPRAQP